MQNPIVNTITTERGFSRDAVLDMLSNQRRRFVLHYLKEQQGRSERQKGGIPIRDVADQVASWEYDKPIAELTPQERKRVQNALQQFHLPKMTDFGFVEYDEEHKVIWLSDAASRQDFYVDALAGGNISWGRYYLGLTAFGAICLVGLFVGLYPFSLATPFMWSVFFVTAFGVSALGHFYDNEYRMRLGASKYPPELDEQ